MKPFSKEEHQIQCNLVSEIPTTDVDELYNLHGGHPYLNALILKHYLSSRNMLDSNNKANQDILRYYADLFYVLEKDKLADKVDKLYCGFNDGVTESQEDYIYNCYGIFKEDDKGFMIPYCTTFDNVLRQRYRENPFSLIWPEAERAIRKSITYAMTEEYGDENMSLWVDEICDFPNVKRDRFNTWKEQREKEIAMYRGRASRNIIDQLYPKDYAVFFEYFWGKYLSAIFKQTLAYWTNNLNPTLTPTKNFRQFFALFFL